MKIHGTEGMSAENIRDEVNRGGRLVIYMYCVSILVMTFKRSAGIRLIKAGHSPVSGGLPYTLISLICGWWGFPWGPIYTIETIYRNLSGGVDVTDEVLATILPQTSGGTPPTIPTPPTLRAEPVAPARGFNTKAALLMVGGAAALIIGGISLYCYNESQQLTVVLVSGLDHPSKVKLNGVEYSLGIHGSKTLQLPEGEFTLSQPQGNPQIFVFAIPFFSHLGEERVAIVNPDRSAILFNEQVIYYSDGTKPPADEDSPYTLLANQQFYFIEKPDYVLEKPPQRTTMPSGTKRLVKTHLNLLTKGELPGIVSMIKEKLGYPAAREHLMIQAGLRTDATLVAAAMQTLKPEDHHAFFQTHLGDRPILVDWHRYYQGDVEYTSPETDLEKEYRGYLAAEPGNGALLYLLGRIIPDQAAARQLYQQALTAQTPCYHAHGAFGYDAMCNGQFTEALAHFNEAEKAGVTSRSRSRYRRQSYWGLKQFDTVLAEVRTERKTDPLDLELAADEIKAAVAGGMDGKVAEEIITGYLNALKKSKPEPKTITESDDYLHAILAYETNQPARYAELAAHFDDPYYKFSAALTTGNLELATKAALAKPKPQTTDLLLLYLLAKRNGDESNAEKHFTQALETMKKDSKGFKQAAVLFTSDDPSAPGKICDLAISPDDKCILLSALGVRDQAHQAIYHSLASKLDYLPDFPHQFLHALLHPALPTST